MSVTLGLMLVLLGPPTADPDMAPPAAAPAPPSGSAPAPTTPSTPGPTAATPTGPSGSTEVAATPAPPPAGEATDAMTANPAGEASGDAPSPPAADPMPSAVDSGADAAGDTPDAQPQSLRDPFDSDPSEMVGWMGHRTRFAQPLPPPPPPVEPQSRRLFIGGYGGPSARLSSVSRKLSTLAGFRGGVLLGERLSLGAAVYRLTYRHNSNITSPDGSEYSLRMGYGGMTFGFTVWRPGRIELAVEGLVGAGSACISDNPRYKDDTFRCIETVKMFVGEPAVTMYLNITDWMRVAVTAGYRLVVREGWRPPNNFLMSGGYGGMDLQFGWFKKPPRRR